MHSSHLFLTLNHLVRMALCFLPSFIEISYILAQIPMLNLTETIVIEILWYTLYHPNIVGQICGIWWVEEEIARFRQILEPCLSVSCLIQSFSWLEREREKSYG